MKTEIKAPAVVGQLEFPVRPASEARWYCVGRNGIATLCADQQDAKSVAFESDAQWPREAPHRAVQLVDIAALAAERERCAEIGRAAQAVLDRWNSPKWEWREQGPTADLMEALFKALKAQRQW